MTLIGRITTGRITTGSFTTGLTTNVILGARGTSGSTAGWTPLATTGKPTTGIEMLGSDATHLGVYVSFLALLLLL